jgi:hypothetical protein
VSGAGRIIGITVFLLNVLPISLFILVFQYYRRTKLYARDKDEKIRLAKKSSHIKRRRMTMNYRIGRQDRFHKMDN